MFLRAQVHPPARRGELQGVEQQIEQDFFQLVAIGENGAQLRGHPGFELDPLVVGDLPGGAGQALDEIGQFQRLAFHLHAAGLQTHQVEQVVDQLEQAHAV